SALMHGDCRGCHHLGGAISGIIGSTLIVARGGGLTSDSQYTFGFMAAAGAAVFWSSYSLLSRRFDAVPTSIVTWFCAATAVLSGICHLLLEQTIWPASGVEWFAVEIARASCRDSG